MRQIVLYLIMLLITIIGATIVFIQGLLPDWITKYSTFYLSGLSGGLGGIIYCLRAIYLNACVKKNWDSTWYPWYYIRPIVSILCGLVSYLFLKTGLLVLEASQHPKSSYLGFLALSFIAGLNVDKFIEKIEEIAQTVWGIKKSRTATRDEE